MDERPDQNMNNMESKRDELGQHFEELGSQIKEGAADWRGQFDRNPMLMMGVALGGGMLLGTMLANSRSRSSKTSWSSSPKYSSSVSDTSPSASFATSPSASASSSAPSYREQRSKATDTLEYMKSALIAFATAKAKEFMSEALPGFNQHLEEAQRKFSSRDPFTSGSYQSGSSDSGSYQGGSTRTEQSYNSPYPQEPVGANPAR